MRLTVGIHNEWVCMFPPGPTDQQNCGSLSQELNRTPTLKPMISQPWSGSLVNTSAALSQVYKGTDMFT